MSTQKKEHVTMKNSSIFLAGTAIVASIFANAEESKNLVVNGNAVDGLNNWKNIQRVVDGGPDGAKCFEVTGSKLVSSQEFIPVDANCEYQLTGWFKSGNDKKNQVFMGLLLLNENKCPIDSISVNVLAQSETVTGGAKKGETVIIVKDASTWQPLFQKKQLTIVFDADDSGEYMDLPNYKYYTVNKLEKKDGIWEATIARPLASCFAAETKVRAHFTSGFYMYVFTMKDNFAGWTKCGGTINPIVKSGAPKSTFWPGTKYVQILILANWGQKDGETLQFGNISLEKVESKK